MTVTLSKPTPRKLDDDTSPPITRQNQLHFILQQLSHEQLETFVLETALRDEAWRDQILIQFGDLLNDDEPAEAKYRQTLNSMINRHIAADGYISRKSAKDLVAAMEAVLNNSRKPTTPKRESIDLCMATISLLPRLGKQMDDTDGHIYHLMRVVCVILWENFKELNTERQRNLFERLLREYAEPLYLDMDLDSFMLTVLRDWAKPHPEWQRLCLNQHERLLKNVGNDKWRKNYLLEQTQALLSAWQKPTQA